MKSRILITTVFVVLASACGRHNSEGRQHSVEAQGGQNLDSIPADEPNVSPPPNQGNAMDPADINVTVETLPTRDGYRFTNHSPASVWYRGYEAMFPLYDLEGRDDVTDWHSIIGGWCGTGLMMFELPRGESLEIQFARERIADFIAIRGSAAFYIDSDWSGTAVIVTGEEIEIVRD